MGRVIKRGRMASETRRNLPSSRHNQRDVCLREEVNHIAGRTYGNMGAVGTLEQIIHLGDQSLPVQTALDSFSIHMLRMLKKDTVKVLGRLLRSHSERSTPNIPFELTTISVLKYAFILGGFLPEVRDVYNSEIII